MAYLKALAHEVYVTEVNINRQEIRMTLYPRAKIRAEELPGLIAEYRGDMKIQTGEAPGLFYQEMDKKNQDSRKMMEKAEEILKRLGQCV